MRSFLLLNFRLAVLLTIALPVFLGVTASVAASEDPAQIMEAAEVDFSYGDFKKAQLAVEDLLRRTDLSVDQRRDALVLLARSHLGLGQEDLARNTFCEVLKVDPLWRPHELIFPQNEIQMFEEAQSSCEPEPTGIEEELQGEEEVGPSPTQSPKTAKSAVLRSIIPGMGQHYKGQKTKGFIFQAAFAGALTFALVSNSAMNSAADDFNNAYEKYNETNSPADEASLWDTVLEKEQEVYDKKNQRDAALIALGGIWVLNLVDAGLGFPLEDSGVQIGHVVTPSGQPAVAVQIWR